MSTHRTLIPRMSDNGSAAMVAIILFFLLCVTYRISVFQQLLNQPDSLAVAMNLMGLTFLSAAIYTFVRLPAYLILVLYFLMSSVHWGGPELRYLPGPYAVMLYLTVSSVLGSTLLLHFALTIVERKQYCYWLYLPTLAMLIAIGMVPLGLEDTVETIATSSMTVTTVLFPIAAIGIVLIYIWPTPRRTVTLLWLSPIIIATIGQTIPGLDLFGRGYEPVNVFILAEIGLLLTIARHHMKTLIS